MRFLGGDMHDIVIVIVVGPHQAAQAWNKLGQFGNKLWHDDDDEKKTRNFCATLHACCFAVPIVRSENKTIISNY